MIRYKIVRASGRESAATIGDAVLTYTLGSTVYAPAGTLGIFVFTTKKAAYASEFRDGLDVGRFLCIRVEPIGKGRTIRTRASHISSLESFIAWCTKFCEYAGRERHAVPGFDPATYNRHLLPAPTGSMVYPAVKVLD